MPLPSPKVADALLDYIDHYELTLNRDFQRDILRLTLQALMEHDVTQNIHAGHYERIENRKTYRNGYRESHFHTHVGEITLYIPKLRRGTYNPQFLSKVAQAIRPLAMSAFVDQLSPTDLHTLSDNLDLARLSTSETQALTTRLRYVTQRHRQSDLRQRRFSALWLDSLRIHTGASIYVAAGVSQREDAEIVDYHHHPTRHNSPSEDQAWTGFVDQLTRRGIDNIQTVYASSPNLLRTLAGLQRLEVKYKVADLNQVVNLPQNVLHLWSGSREFSPFSRRTSDIWAMPTFPYELAAA